MLKVGLTRQRKAEGSPNLRTVAKKTNNDSSSGHHACIFTCANSSAGTLRCAPGAPRLKTAPQAHLYAGDVFILALKHMLGSSHADTAAYAGKLLSARFNSARGKLKVNLTHTHTQRDIHTERFQHQRY